MRLNKIVKELKRGWLRVEGLFQAGRMGVSLSDYVRIAENRRHYGIDADGRVRLRHLEIDICKGCNLRCEHCSHLSPYRSGYISATELSEWFDCWNEKIAPEEVNLLGGEPLLHPELDRVILESKRIWNRSVLRLVSNGLLFSRVSDKVLDAIRTTRIHVSLSKHCGGEKSETLFRNGLKRLDAAKIPYTVRDSYRDWMRQHRKNDEGRPIPFDGDAEKAWKVCGSKFCASLAGNRLYKCSVLACMTEGVREGVLDDAWKSVLSYRPLEPSASANDILEHLRQAAVAECRVCPEAAEIITPQQIPVELLKRKSA